MPCPVRLRSLRSVLPMMVVLGGCAIQEPRNHDAVDRGEGYRPTLASFGSESENKVFATALRADVDLSRCRANTQYDDLPTLKPTTREIAVSKGDLLRIAIPGDELLSGDYEIEGEGLLRLPQLPPFRAHGVEAAELERRIRQALLDAQLYRNEGPPVSVKIIERAPVLVYVRGAVFEPKAVEINNKSANTLDPLRQKASGDLYTSRTLSNALRAAAGVRPDADVQRIVIRRDGVAYRVDMKDAALSRRFFDPYMMPEDEVEVPSMGCFQPGLATANPITRNGLKVYLSNLATPVNGNSGSSIDKNTLSLKYGATWMQVLFKMNCVGGSVVTANRKTILASRNPVTGRMEVVQRNVEDFIRRADRDAHDPVLMPDDAVACYDSTLQSARDVLGTFDSMGIPLTLLGFF